MSANAAPVFQARGLVKRYGQVTALDGADFELRAGEILAVIGDNGAGKSTLIKALCGAVIPDAGEIRLEGKPVQVVDATVDDHRTLDQFSDAELTAMLAQACWRRL